MNTIKNIYKLTGLVEPDSLHDLDNEANLLLKSSNISFKILEVKDQDSLSEMTIRVEQGKHFSENYFDLDGLIKLTRELFFQFIHERMIYIHPIPYSLAIVDVVTPEWINKHMLKYNIRIKDLVENTGIDKSNYSAWINGLRPMSQIVKSMIFNVMKCYALKSYVNWLNENIEHTGLFLIKKYFDKDLIENLLYSNKNAARYKISFKEVEDDYIITLSK